MKISLKNKGRALVLGGLLSLAGAADGCYSFFQDENQRTPIQQEYRAMDARRESLRETELNFHNFGQPIEYEEVIKTRAFENSQKAIQEELGELEDRIEELSKNPQLIKDNSASCKLSLRNLGQLFGLAGAAYLLFKKSLRTYDKQSEIDEEAP